MHTDEDPRRPRFLPAILIAMFILRWWLGTLPGYPPDLRAYKYWALWGSTYGVHTLYDEDSIFDYPPLYGYLLAPIGHLETRLEPELAGRVLVPDDSGGPRDSIIFSMLVKIPPLIFDILLALLLALLVRRGGLWARWRSWGGWAPALLFLLHPAILFISGYWGQPDCIETLFVMLALTLILLRRPELGWIAAALGLLMKPLAAPFFPLLALATLVTSGFRRLLTGGLAGIGTFLAGFLPFLLAGRGAQITQRLLSDVDAMPFASVNGHNLWWLLAPWRPASDPWLGPLTPKMIGLALFGICYLGILWWIWTRRGPARTGGLGGQSPWYVATAAVAVCFFTFSTHMHENHLYPALPFLMLMAGRDRRWAWIMGLVGLSLLVNMATHDLILGELFLRDAGGASGFFHPDFSRDLSRLEWGLARGNALLTIGTCGALLVLMFRTHPRRERE